MTEEGGRVSDVGEEEKKDWDPVLSLRSKFGNNSDLTKYTITAS